MLDLVAKYATGWNPAGSCNIAAFTEKYATLEKCKQPGAMWRTWTSA